MNGTTPADNTIAALPVDAATPGAKAKPPQTLRQFEGALRELGFSTRESVAIAKNGFKAIGIDEPESDLSALKAALAKNTLIFTERTL